MRINRYIASCGVASRRKADILVAQGRVSVNGTKIAEPGVAVDPEKDRVEVDGILIGKQEAKVYILLNKPVGYISTASDQFGRKSVIDLVDVKYRIYPVGRLDYDTSGLLILTNDGDFTYEITHPKHEVVKTYIAMVKGIPSRYQMKQFEDGLEIDGILTSKAGIRLIASDNTNDQGTLEIKIHEGRNRQVRKMCEAIGHEVIALERVAIGSLRIGDLKSGHWRYLSRDEVMNLRKS